MFFTKKTTPMIASIIITMIFIKGRVNFPFTIKVPLFTAPMIGIRFRRAVAINITEYLRGSLLSPQ